MKKAFQETELQFFERVSFDRNPLHRDADYARKTQFGQRVVYGMYATLFALGEWLNGRTVRLKSVKGEFKRPIFLDEVYDVSISEKDGQADIAFSRNGAPYLKARASHSGFEKQSFPWPNVPPDPLRIHGALEAQFDDENEFLFPAAQYTSGWDPSVDPPKALRLERTQLPFEQSAALLWSSYFVGMQMPGRQALFSSFEFQFEDPEADTNVFEISPLRIELDRRINRLRIQGSASGVSSFMLSSFVRPDPVQPSMAETEKIIGRGTSMRGKRVLITGASRGFGATLAQAFGLQGAQLWIHFLQSRDDAEQLARSIEIVGPRPVVIRGDASREEDWAHIVQDLQAIDILILNASPIIPALNFKNQNSEDVLSFVSRSLSMIVSTCTQCLAKMTRGGTVVLVSSVFVENPQPGFSHYVAAKAAGEGFMRSLAVERPDLKFQIFRAPRMLTDQTNSVILGKDMTRPAEVAKQLLERLTG